MFDFGLELDEDVGDLHSVKIRKVNSVPTQTTEEVEAARQKGLPAERPVSFTDD